MNSAVMPYPLRSVQRAVMAHLADVSASPGSDVFDLRAVARTMGARHQPAVSRAADQPVRRGVLEWMVPAGTGSPPSSSNAYAVSPMRACHRNRKKWWPQRAHRQGSRSQWKAVSMAFRAPTLLKSINLQCGQRVENSPAVARIMAPYRLSPHCLRQGWPDFARTASSTARAGCRAAQPPCGLPPVPHSVVPVFSGRAPTL